MEGRCKDCKWWQAYAEPATWGACALAASTDHSDKHPQSKMLTWTRVRGPVVDSPIRGIETDLQTAPDFGCIQYEAKEA